MDLLENFRTTDWLLDENLRSSKTNRPFSIVYSQGQSIPFLDTLKGSDEPSRDTTTISLRAKSEDEHDNESVQYATTVGVMELPNVETPAASWIICRVGGASKTSKVTFDCRFDAMKNRMLIWLVGNVEHVTIMLWIAIWRASVTALLWLAIWHGDDELRLTLRSSEGGETELFAASEQRKMTGVTAGTPR
jgi:hypothetical protein